MISTEESRKKLVIWPLTSNKRVNLSPFLSEAHWRHAVREMKIVRAFTDIALIVGIVFISFGSANQEPACVWAMNMHDMLIPVVWPVVLLCECLSFNKSLRCFWIWSLCVLSDKLVQLRRPGPSSYHTQTHAAQQNYWFHYLLFIL